MAGEEVIQSFSFIMMIMKEWVWHEWEWHLTIPLSAMFASDDEDNCSQWRCSSVDLWVPAVPNGDAVQWTFGFLLLCVQT